MAGRDSQKHEDGEWMDTALRLARRGEGLTRPNPPVGAVVVRNGRLVGSGYHRRAGGPHAEVYALRQAGARARGATLYVTLEPCSSWGRTPPCTEAILAAGIRRVVAAIRDPNPRHAGRGFWILRRAGVEVEWGVGAEQAEDLIAPFASFILRKRPHLTLKLGLTLDGRIADRTGRSRWITGAASRQVVQALRRRADAILVGAGTASADDPGLLPHPPRGRAPFRIIVDAIGRVPLASRVFNDPAASRTLFATTAACPEAYRRALAARGVEVALLPACRGRLSLRALMPLLYKRGIMQVLCEGGGMLAASLVAEGWADELYLFTAPLLLGGAGVAALAGRGWLLRDAPRFTLKEVARVGEDVMIRAARRKG